MALTLNEVKQKLLDNFDADALLDLLHINSQTLVDWATDYIEEHIEELEQALEEFPESSMDIWDQDDASPGPEIEGIDNIIDENTDQ